MSPSFEGVEPDFEGVVLDGVVLDGVVVVVVLFVPCLLSFLSPPPVPGAPLSLSFSPNLSLLFSPEEDISISEVMDWTMGRKVSRGPLIMEDVKLCRTSFFFSFFSLSLFFSVNNVMKRDAKRWKRKKRQKN